MARSHLHTPDATNFANTSGEDSIETASAADQQTYRQLHDDVQQRFQVGRVNKSRIIDDADNLDNNPSSLELENDEHQEIATHTAKSAIPVEQDVAPDEQRPPPQDATHEAGGHETGNAENQNEEMRAEKDTENSGRRCNTHEWDTAGEIYLMLGNNTHRVANSSKESKLQNLHKVQNRCKVNSKKGKGRLMFL
uniref:Uncharacterized protein n=1 Tax=Leersia perrieri TaxID=77586 RepID=A0A0D9WEE9_9ORYZ